MAVFLVQALDVKGGVRRWSDELCEGRKPDTGNTARPYTSFFDSSYRDIGRINP
jgi:hypothetical protein